MHIPRTLSGPRRTVPDGLAAAFGLAGIAALLLLLVWRSLLLSDGLPLIDWESAERLLLAQRWAQSPFFGNDHGWLPLYFALQGAFLRLLPHPALAPAALNTLLSLGGLLAYWGVLDRINPGRRLENLVLVALGGLSLRYVENAILARSDALFTCCVLAGIFFHLRRLETQRPADQAAAAAFFAAAALTRYEGWAFALCLLVPARGRKRLWLDLTALLPIAAWLAFGRHDQRGGLSFLPDLSNFAHQTTPGLNLGRLEALLTNIIIGAPGRLDMQMLVPMPLLALLGLCGSVLLYRRDGAARQFVLLSWLPLSALAYLCVVQQYPVVPEHMALFQLLFLACLAPLLGRALRPLGMPAAAAAFAACASVALRIGLYDTPLIYDSGPQGRRVSVLIEEFSRRYFSEEDAVLVEVREFCPEREVCEEPVLLRTLLHPRRVLLDRPDLSYRPAPGGRRLPDQPSRLDAPAPELRARLSQDGVRVIVLHDPRRAARLAPEWLPAGSWGRYRLLLRRGDRLRPGLAARLRTMAKVFPDEAR